jgi:formylglycine-generating enzyme required for sulfatase activity
VRIGHRFAVGRYPVTFEEYDRFATETVRERRDDEGWGRGRRPVINVFWNDARDYASWLSQETGKPYRLLSEAEWEYACRAGTTTRYSWGDHPPTPEQANFGQNVSKTSEVGAYPANPWGLYDMHGNVWEWVEDVWHSSYEGAPSDGRAWTTGDDSRRVLRGGSWDSGPGDLRSAFRNWLNAVSRYDFIGFRVARTLR